MARTNRAFSRVGCFAAEGGETSFVRGGSVLGKVTKPSLGFCEVKKICRDFSEFLLDYAQLNEQQRSCGPIS
jgi:hypothetical protein